MKKCYKNVGHLLVSYILTTIYLFPLRSVPFQAIEDGKSSSDSPIWQFHLYSPTSEASCTFFINISVNVMFFRV